MSKRITSPLDDNTIKDLKAGDQVLINGIIYTARDAAHKRLTEALDRGEDPPFTASNNFCGPISWEKTFCPAKIKHNVINKFILINFLRSIIIPLPAPETD